MTTFSRYTLGTGERSHMEELGGMRLHDHLWRCTQSTDQMFTNQSCPASCGPVTLQDPEICAIDVGNWIVVCKFIVQIAVTRSFSASIVSAGCGGVSEVQNRPKCAQSHMIAAVTATPPLGGECKLRNVRQRSSAPVVEATFNRLAAAVAAAQRQRA